tara:strand:+ start:1731 stop:2798 length:1068 start_codon:yes stop_codon:yes gene_type:complete
LNIKAEDSEQVEILFNEKQKNTITYSKSMFCLLTKQRPSDYAISFTNNKIKNELLVPYTVIKKAKIAKEQNVKEIVLLASERPDRNTNIRSTLDLWGLSSYIEYLYTTSELSFLEGLTPIFEGGFLSLAELKRISEMLAFIKLLLPSSQLSHYEKLYGKKNAKKYFDIRLKMLEWSGKLNIPIITGLIISDSETDSQINQTIDILINHQKEFNNIHSISIQAEALFSTGKLTKKTDTSLLKAIKYIQSQNIDVTLSTCPIHLNNITPFLDLGITDFGSIPINPQILFPNAPEINFDELENQVSSHGFQLKQRLPIKYDFIKNGLYSKKLGQVFDSYKYKIKKYEQELNKETKLKQ